MTQLTVQEALGIMQSDNGLWNRAEKRQGKDGLELVLDLPWGIGTAPVTLQGTDNAKGRRNAVSAYGDYIRGIIKERIDDDEVTSRARAAAARHEQADSDSSGSGIYTGERDKGQSSVQEAAPSQSKQTHDRSAKRSVGLRETLTSRRLEIEDDIEFFRARIAEADTELKELYRELRGIVAAVEAMEDDDAPEDSTETEGDRGPEAAEESDSSTES